MKCYRCGADLETVNYHVIDDQMHINGEYVSSSYLRYCNSCFYKIVAPLLVDTIQDKEIKDFYAIVYAEEVGG